MSPVPGLLKISPLDACPSHTGSLVQIHGSEEDTVDLVPSRFNAHTNTAEGRMVLWNSRAGTINVFQAKINSLLERALSQEGFRGPLKGLTKYLYDRGYLVRKDFDEYRSVQVEIGQQHYRTDNLELILLSSEDCNFRCTYCYEDFPRGTMSPEVRERIKKLVRRRISRLERFSVAWFGGEPLYGFEAIADLGPFFAQICEEKGVLFESNMTTNGYLLSPEVADQLLSWKINNFQITLDGVGETHDRKRPTRDGGSSFTTIMDNLLSLHRRGEDFRVGIRINFDQENRSEIETLLVLLNRNFGGDPRFGVALHAIGRWGGPNDENLPVCEFKESEEVRRELTVSEGGKHLRVQSLLSAAGLGQQVCYAARPYNFLIGADGNVMKCTVVLSKEDYNIVGRLSNDGDILLDRDKFARWVEPAFEQDSGCQRCTLLPACQGMHCPLVRIQTHEAPCPPAKVNLRQELLLAASRSNNQG